jgi:ABC-2 type transport system permease protein
VTEALHAEWTKLRTLTSTTWLLLASVAVTVGVGAAVAGAATYDSAPAQDTTKTALAGLQAGQAVIVILAVLAVTNEYSTGMIRVTLTAIPRRLEVLAAKTIIVGGLSLLAGTVGVGVSLLIGRIVLDSHGFTVAHGYPALSLTNAATVRAATGSVLYLTLIALLSLGAATAVRETATAIGTILGALYLFPILVHAVSDPHWQRHLDQISPMNAGLAIQNTRNLHNLVVRPWTGLGILAAWAAGGLIIGGLVLVRRDA